VKEKRPLKVNTNNNGNNHCTTGKRLSVNYTGTLKGGKVFDSNMDGGKPFHFRLGGGEVIQAWDVAFAGMKVCLSAS
jgi:FKBP-type peptidyl-prolyl cis-trans isomerase